MQISSYFHNQISVGDKIMKKFTFATCCLALLLTLFSTNICAQAQDTSDQAERISLRGLPGVYLYVSDLDADIEGSGLSRDQLQTDVEAKLRKAGIRVLTQEERRQTPSMPALLVVLNSQKVKQAPAAGGDDLYSYSCSIELRQMVSLKGRPSISTLATTWSTGGIGFTEASNIRRVRDAISYDIDEFIRAYRAVNPK